MAKIQSKSLLNVGVEIFIDEAARTIRLVEAGNLIAKDGVTLQAVYSKLVDLWATMAYQDSPFPMYAIDALSGQFQIGTDGATYSGWTWYDDTTRNMLRDGGWAEYSAAGVKLSEYCGFIGLGSVTPVGVAQPYYHLDPSDGPTNFPFVDQFNVGIKVFDSVLALDKRTYAKCFEREYGKKFKSSVLADTGSTATGPFKQNFLISNETDLKITTLLGTDATVGDAAMAGAPYSTITIAYYTANQSKAVGAASYPFRIIIQGNGATLEQIYAKVQYLLRQNSNINTGGDAGSKIGKVQSDLLTFVGDTLVTATGVFIEGVAAADSNRIEFYDQDGEKRTNPYTAAGTLAFNAALVGGVFRLMYSAGPGADDNYGEAGAITVKDADGNPVAGTITGVAIDFTFDYDGDTEGGAAATNKQVILIGIAPGAGKFASAVGTLTRSKTIAISLVAEADRVYSAA